MGDMANMEQMGAMAVKLVEVDRLIGYARNAKKHSNEQIDLICRSIEEYGWTVPCLIDGANGIIAATAAWRRRIGWG